MSRIKIAATVGAVIFLPLLLSGCLRTNADITVGQDGDIGSAVVQVGIAKNVAEQAGIRNIADFETYIKSKKQVMPGDNCQFGATESEYTLDCHTPDVIDTTGNFTGITTTVNGDELILTARKNALTEDLSEYDPTGQAVGTIMFYFDGDVSSVSAPTSSVRTPSSSVVAFDLKNGQFFHEDAIIVVKRNNPYMMYFVGALLLALVGAGVAIFFANRRRAENPFVNSEEGKDTPKKRMHRLDGDDESSGGGLTQSSDGVLRGPGGMERRAVPNGRRGNLRDADFEWRPSEPLSDDDVSKKDS